MVKLLKNKKIMSEEQQEIFRFLSLLVIVVLFIVGVYFATRIFVKKDIATNNEETAVTNINYNKVVFGTMFDKDLEEYYVYAFDSENTKANYYGSLADKYSSNENSLNIYHIDLNDSMNRQFVSKDKKTNPDAKTVEELKVGEVTLIKIANGEIVKYLENVDDIKKELTVK